MNDTRAIWKEKYIFDFKRYKKLDIPTIQNNFNLINFIEDEERNKYVAKSIMDQSDNHWKYLFSREIKILLHIQHPTIISIQGFSFIDLNCDNNITFLMKYMEKGSLSNLFSKDGINKCNNTQKQIILIGISFGMMFLHKHHIINRDLKPENVLLDTNYKPCLTDFNLSKSFDPKNSINQSMTCCGTVLYMAPEVFYGNNYNTKIDVYSFGILMYEIVSGIRAYKDIKIQSIPIFFKEVSEGLRPQLNENMRKENSGLAQIIDLCLIKDPKERPTFREIFKKLSLLSYEYFSKYERLYPFLKDNYDNKLSDYFYYSFKDVDVDEVHSYVDELLSSLKDEKIVDEIKFIETKKICQQVFSVKINDFKIPEEINDSKKIFLNNLLFFFPDEFEFNAISNNFQSYSFDEFYDSFLFPIISTNLSEIHKNNNLFEIEEIFKIFSLYTFYSAISICIQIILEQKINFVIILQILNDIIKVSFNISEKTIFHEIAVKLFVNIINLAEKEDIIDNFENIFIEIQIFLNNKNNLQFHSDEIIPIFAQKLTFSENELSFQAKTFINLITNTLKSHPNNVTHEVILSSIEIIKDFIVRLDESCMAFFLQSTKYIGTNDSMKILKQMVKQILIKYYNDDFIESDTNVSKAVKKFFRNNNSKNFHPPKDLNQLEKVSLPDFSTCFKVQEVSYFLNNEAIPVITTIEQIITLKEELAQYFVFYAVSELQSFEIKKSKTIYYQKCAFIFYLIFSILKKFTDIIIQVPAKLNCPLFNSKEIFDPNVTYFDQTPNLEIVNSLRHFIIKFLSKKHPNVLNQILQENCFYPNLFRECIYHLATAEINQDDFYHITDILISNLANYRVNSDTSKLTDNFIICLTIRKTILSFFKQFLIDENILKKVFKSTVFINYFCLLLMEPPIRDIFIELLFIYLKIVSMVDNIHYLCQKIVKLINVCFNEMTQKDAILVFNSIINIINKSMISNESLAYKFEYISLNLCKSLMVLNINSEKPETVESLISSVFDFLFEIYKIKPINEKDSLQLESLVTHFLPKLDKVKIIERFVQIIGNKKDSVIHPNFEIRQHKLLCTFIRIFIKTKYIYNILQFISKLCSFSSANCFKCHEGKLDLFIIDTIIEYRNNICKLVLKDELNINPSENKKLLDSDILDDEINIVILESKEGLDINEVIVDLFLHLFAQIASIVSSMPVVHKFFSMICQTDSNYLSIIHENMFRSLNNIIALSKYSISASLPLSSLNISILNIPIDSISNGFTFIFWIFRSTSSDHFVKNIAQILDGTKQSFIIGKKDNILYITIQLETNVQTCKFVIDIPYRTWSMISVTSIPHFQENQSEITLYINQNEVQKFTLNEIFLPDKNVNCIINHSNDPEQSNFTDPDLIGVFILSMPLTKEKIIELATNGQRSPTFMYYADDIIFAYKPQCDKNISLLTLFKNYQISENYSTIVPSMKSQSFFDLLLFHHELDITDLLIEQLHKKFKDGSSIKSIEEHEVDFLFNLSSFGIEFEKSLCHSNCISSIAYYLCSLDDSQINFELYENYFKLLEKISYYDLQKMLIDQILMNYNLWLKCSINIRQKIFKHWEKNLYFLYKDIIDSIRCPEWFIFISFNLFDQNNPDDQIYSDCRNSLHSIIHESFRKNLTLKHIMLIISLVCTKTSLYEIKDSLDFLLSILSDIKLINIAKISFSDIILPFSTIFDINIIDDEIIYKLISQLVSFYRMNDLKPSVSFNTLVQQMIFKITINQEYLLSKRTFVYLISLLNTNKRFELLPLISINAIYGDVDYINHFLTNIPTDFDFYVDKESMIYHVLLIIKYFNEDKILYREIISKIISLFKYHLVQLIETINIIGFSCLNSEKFDEIKHDVLYLILISKLYQYDNTIYLINIINNFIFFRPEKSKSELLKLFIKSPFNDENNENSNHNFNDSMDQFGKDMKKDIEIIKKIPFLIKEAIESISNKENHEFTQKFGLRIDNSFQGDITKWLDFDLANENINLYVNIKSQNFNISKISLDMNFLSEFINDYIYINSEKVYLKKQNIKYYIDLEYNLTNLLLNEKNENSYTFGKIFLSFYNSHFTSIQSNISDQLYRISKKYFEDAQITEMEMNCKNREAWLDSRCYLNISKNSSEIDTRIKRINSFNKAHCPFKFINNSHEKAIKKPDNMMNERLEKFECNEITIKDEKNSIIQINNQFIFITTIKRQKTRIINFNEVKSILYAYKYGRHVGFQIFTRNGKCFYLFFKTSPFMHFVSSFYSISSFGNAIIQNRPSKDFINSLHIVNSWLEGKISNFEYLMKLNILSGRSFHDIDQYPVFPWILSDYESQKLDLSSPSVYRDLSKPIGENGEQRLDVLNYDLYDIFYLNRFSVLFYLSHMEPFSSQRKQISDHDELLYFRNEFTSIDSSFKDVIANNNFFRELVPEFFYLPEFLKNIELPPWANQSAIEFVYLNRKALESEYASSHLNEWIDLIWGCKQNKMNASYLNYEVSHLLNKYSVNSNVDQLPIKLFNDKHPAKRVFVKKSSIPFFKESKINHFIINFDVVSRILSANVSKLNKKEALSFKLIDSSGNIYIYSADFSSINSNKIRLKTKGTKNIQKEANQSIFWASFIDINQICFIDNNRDCVKVIDCLDLTQENMNKQNSMIISAVANQEGWIAVSTNDARVTLYNLDMESFSSSNNSSSLFSLLSMITFPSTSDKLTSSQEDLSNVNYKTISSFKGVVNCIAISSTFNIFVCGTKFDFLLFYELNLSKANLNKIVKLKGRPQKILITDNFGFVLVLLTKIKNNNIIEKLVLYSVNGEKIRSRKIYKNNRIIEMINTSSFPGKFDFIIATNEKNQIFVFEAFYLNVGKPIFVCKSKIIKITYLKEESLIFAFCEDGTVSVIHYPII
ncbi:hypothetical protein M9Y10_018751 [Tritrichomonas musculus]|uniref:Protein kinase domain-containing protein n=1 Tax=Tritrichomonas musculus TaxID=1915356 RepID=A0ABR2HMF0_9EUKA